LPAPFPEERARSISWDLPEILFESLFFCLSTISLLLEVAGNTNAHVLKIEHVSIVSWDWKLLGAPIKVYEFVLLCIC